MADCAISDFVDNERSQGRWGSLVFGDLRVPTTGRSTSVRDCIALELLGGVATPTRVRCTV